MKDAAKQTAMDTTKHMATGLAKDALKTATGGRGARPGAQGCGQESRRARRRRSRARG